MPEVTLPEIAPARKSQRRANVLLFLPRQPVQATCRGRRGVQRGDLTVARVIAELEDLRRRTGARGPRWRAAVGALQVFLASVGPVTVALAGLPDMADAVVDQVTELLDWPDVRALPSECA